MNGKTNLGKKKSLETRRKMSETRKGMKHKTNKFTGFKKTKTHTFSKNTRNFREISKILNEEYNQVGNHATCSNTYYDAMNDVFKTFAKLTNERFTEEELYELLKHEWFSVAFEDVLKEAVQQLGDEGFDCAK